VAHDDGPKAVSAMATTADDHGPALPDGREDDSTDASDYEPGLRGSPLFTGVVAVCDTVTRLAGVDGAAVAVFAPSHSRELVYATDAVAQQIDDLQFTLGEGPCLDAYRSASPQLCPRLDVGTPMDRWPAFCIDAADAGGEAVFAFPVLGVEHAIAPPWKASTTTTSTPCRTRSHRATRAAARNATHLARVLQRHDYPPYA
jgi:hypothetical protein